MKLRKSLYSTPSIGKIDQGAIFPNAISVDYSDCEVFGIVITPRCDLANSKVSTVHYLPIIKYSDWLTNDLFHVVNEIVYKNVLSDLRSKLDAAGLSASILEFIKYSELQTILLKREIHKKDQKQILTSFEKFQKINDILHSKPTLQEINDFLRQNGKIVKSIIKEISEHKRRNYYFLEPWERNPNEPIYVVLLREVRCISREFAAVLTQGCYINQYSKNSPSSRYDDIAKTEDDELFSCYEAILNPPFMEHLIQTFFHNIGRVGIEEYDFSIESFLFSHI